MWCWLALSGSCIFAAEGTPPMRTDGVRRSSIVLSAGDNHGERRDRANALHA
jgi:hypothetical protein